MEEAIYKEAYETEFDRPGLLRYGYRLYVNALPGSGHALWPGIGFAKWSNRRETGKCFTSFLQ